MNSLRAFDAYWCRNSPSLQNAAALLAGLQMWTSIRAALAPWAVQDKTLMMAAALLSHQAQMDAAGGKETATESTLWNAIIGSQWKADFQAFFSSTGGCKEGVESLTSRSPDSWCGGMKIWPCSSESRYKYPADSHGGAHNEMLHISSHACCTLSSICSLPALPACCWTTWHVGSAFRLLAWYRGQISD